MRILVYIITYFALSTVVSAQDADNKNYDKYIGFQFDNDIFFQTDYYYTSGEKIYFINPIISKSPVDLILISPSSIGDVYYSGLSIEHRMFTPTDTPNDTVKIGDRPYAASLSISQIRVTENNVRGYRVLSSLSIGAIGKFAFGRELQSLIHGLTPSQLPVGWDSQISNGLLLNYGVELDRRILYKEGFEWIGSGSVNLGSVNTDLSLSTTIRLGKMDTYFTSYSPKVNSKFKIWVEASYAAKVVFYNAYLQGGMFSNTSPYVIESSNVERLIHTFTLHTFIQYNKHRVIFQANNLSPEFEGAVWHTWGSVGYQYWF